MKNDVREELKRIEDFLLRNNASSRDLWVILSALRGPDGLFGGADRQVSLNEIKRATTEQVRRAAFPRIAEQYDSELQPPSGGTPVPADFDKHTFLPDLGIGVSPHFDEHIYEAARALDMFVKEENND